MNGTAHTWHHTLHILGGTIYNGAAPVGGQMPVFKNQLSEGDIIDVIAHVQSYWPDNIYSAYCNDAEVITVSAMLQRKI